jgi:hypothetical protein
MRCFDHSLPADPIGSRGAFAAAPVPGLARRGSTPSTWRSAPSRTQWLQWWSQQLTGTLRTPGGAHLPESDLLRSPFSGVVAGEHNLEPMIHRIWTDAKPPDFVPSRRRRPLRRCRCRPSLRSDSDHNPSDPLHELPCQNNRVVQFQRFAIRLDKVHCDKAVAGPNYAGRDLNNTRKHGGVANGTDRARHACQGVHIPGMLPSEAAFAMTTSCD